MSTASKVTLGVAGIFTCGMFVYVNGKQWLDQKKLKESVAKDIQRQEMKKMENMYWLEKQREMSNILETYQNKDDKIAMSLLQSSKQE